MKKRYYDDHDYYNSDVNSAFSDYNKRYNDRSYRNNEYYRQENKPGVAYINNFNPNRYKNSSNAVGNNENTDDFYDNTYSDEYTENYEKDDKGSSQLLIIMQIISCATIILAVLVTKSILPHYYEPFKTWYLTELNKSIIVGENLLNSSQLPTGQNLSISSESSLSSNTGLSAKQTSKKDLDTALLSRPIKDVAVITSMFGDARDNGSKHKGLDIATDHGNNIYCPLRGSVELTDENNSYGKYVIIDHGNGIKTLYAHCDSINVKIGKSVSVNDIIAHVGSTGDSTGPHLHFELMINNEYCDPLNFMKEAYV